jgi:hypothetical protein
MASCGNERRARAALVSSWLAVLGRLAGQCDQQATRRSANAQGSPRGPRACSQCSVRPLRRRQVDPRLIPSLHDTKAERSGVKGMDENDWWERLAGWPRRDSGSMSWLSRRGSRGAAGLS